MQPSTVVQQKIAFLIADEQEDGVRYDLSIGEKLS
jgi:hypothetical protein